MPIGKYSYLRGPISKMKRFTVLDQLARRVTVTDLSRASEKNRLVGDLTSTELNGFQA